MFCYDADDIQAPIKKFQQQVLDPLLFHAGLLGFTHGRFI